MIIIDNIIKAYKLYNHYANMSLQHGRQPHLPILRRIKQGNKRGIALYKINQKTLYNPDGKTKLFVYWETDKTGFVFADKCTQII